ncbi:hypothetical protein Leryth_005651 [Lithospermum erythrorhizon]|nr:hypothetical protein Leryth_005651 [Lithospermum erythrorhizon]
MAYLTLGMDIKKQKSGKKRLSKWFFRKKKSKRYDPFDLRGISDVDVDEDSDDCSDAMFVRPMETNPRVLTDDLRIFVGSWNVAGRSPVGSLAVDLDDWLNLKDDADIYVLGFQEVVPLKAKHVIGAENPTAATNWNVLIGKTLNDKYGCPWLTPMLNPINNDDYNYAQEYGTSETDLTKDQDKPSSSYSKYKLMASKKMVGVFISVWMRSSVLKRFKVSGVKVCSVACGIMGYLGNKGSVSVSMTIEGTSFCFTAAHLASGEKFGDEGKRNHQVSEIFRRTSFPRRTQDGDKSYPLTILGHDRIFWFGDLNYRLFLEDNLARQLIRTHNWDAMQNFDQLRNELGVGGIFQGWEEGDIEFAPTYKYSSSNYDRYSGGAPARSGEKRRTPAWCDRILWNGEGVKQLHYVRSESKFSDHRPVSALFSTQIVALRKSNPKVFPTPLPTSSTKHGNTVNLP